MFFIHIMLYRALCRAIRQCGALEMLHKAIEGSLKPYVILCEALYQAVYGHMRLLGPPNLFYIATQGP